MQEQQQIDANQQASPGASGGVAVDATVDTGKTDFRAEFTHFLQNAPEGADDRTLQVVGWMNSRMIDENVPMSRHHFEQATASIARGDGPWNFFKAENIDVITSNPGDGGGRFYDIGRFLHEAYAHFSHADQCVVPQTPDTPPIDQAPIPVLDDHHTHALPDPVAAPDPMEPSSSAHPSPFGIGGSALFGSGGAVGLPSITQLVQDTAQNAVGDMRELFTSPVDDVYAPSARSLFESVSEASHNLMEMFASSGHHGEQTGLSIFESAGAAIGDARSHLSELFTSPPISQEVSVPIPVDPTPTHHDQVSVHQVHESAYSDPGSSHTDPGSAHTSDVGVTGGLGGGSSDI
jgi:hypothetical protein